MALLFV